MTFKHETETNIVNNTFSGRGLNSSTLPNKNPNLPTKRSYAWEKVKTNNARSSSNFPGNDSSGGAIIGSVGIISGSGAGSTMTGNEMGNSTGNAQFLQVPQASASTSGTSRLIPQNEPVQSPQQSPQTSSRRSSKVCKVLSLFDLISSPSLSMKIQIMGGKITENLGFESLLR